MPQTEVRVYRDRDGIAELLAWLQNLEVEKPIAYQRCLAGILELSEQGNAMRRPHADYLRDGIYELRATVAGTHHRILYFFMGRRAVCLSQGLQKTSRVPPKEIELAIRRKAEVQDQPHRFTADFEV